ncbi:MAG TPA: hypothetical protein VHY08_21455 [Bacillota bacterium]|nr:hypothetical protein [Bacillota bacterium]
MRKIFLLFLLISCLVLLVGCFPPLSKLTIVNTSGQDLELVKWNGTWFSNGEVWDDGTYSWISCLINGTAVTRSVDAGVDYVTFWLVNGGKYMTINTVYVPEGRSRTFNLSATQVYNSINITPGIISQKVEDMNLSRTK